VVPGGKLEVWLIDLARDGAGLARLAATRKLLSPADQRRFSAYRRGKDAEAFAASRAGLALVLEETGGTSGTALRYSASGKPFVPGLPEFSLSRTDGYVAIGVNPLGAVGLDIEAVRPIDPGSALVERVAQRVADRWPADRRHLAAWTIVEAWSKFRGMRLADLLDSSSAGRELEDALGENGQTRLVALPLPDGLVGHAWFTGDQAGIEMRALAPELT
jgi:phosphopantetheinyl transferase